MSILVVGATGAVGRHVTAELVQEGAEVRALTRDPAKAQLPDGARPVYGDLTDPQTLRGKRVDAVFLAWPFGEVGAAAEVLKVLTEHAGRVVYLSSAAVRDVPGRGPESPGRPDGEIEALVEGTGVPRTFLRPYGFMSNTLRWAEELRGTGVVRGFGGAAGLTLIDERDIAAVAVRALTEDGHDGARYALTGPAAPTQAEQVRILGEATGREVRWEEVSREAAGRQMRATGWPPAIVDGALDFIASRVDAPEQVTSTVLDVTGAPARSLREWAVEHADRFR